MCGRYTFYTSEENREAMKIAREVEERYGAESFQAGEIFPTNRVPVLWKGKEGRIGARLQVWGFPHFQGKGVIINAREETVGEKKMFQGALEKGRCVVPTTGFFEWKEVVKGKKKEKYLFRVPGQEMVYLAGLCRRYGDEERFVILTTCANSSMEDVHKRMPVIMRRNMLDDWIYRDDCTQKVLSQQMPALERKLIV